MIDNISPWDQAFKDYVNKIKREEEPFEELIKNETYFREKFTQFLFSPRGGIFQANFWFSSDLVCGEPAPDVLLQALPYSHKRCFLDTKRLMLHIFYFPHSDSAALQSGSQP